MEASTPTVSILETQIYSDSLAFQPQVIQSSVRGLITPTALSTATKPLSITQLRELIGLYGPVLYLHPKDPYLNTSIEHFLRHSKLFNKKTGKEIDSPAPDSLPQSGDDDQYSLRLQSEGKRGDFASAKAYVRAFWQPGMPHTDIQFWFLSAYNGPGTLHVNGLVLDSIVNSGDVNLEPLGEHVGDWETCMIRVDNTTLKVIAIWLSQHSKGQFFTGDSIDRNFTFEASQPLIYSTLNGHALFSREGSNPSEYRKIGGIPLGVDFFIRNDTSKSNLRLDCAKRYELVSADWLQLPPPKWVTYPFRWGPQGNSVNLKPSAVAEIVKAAAGASFARIFHVSVLTIVAGEILSHFVKRDVNGATAPIAHESWKGTYPAY
jgi:Vacuolar protein sorting-associated protein 62